MEENKKKEKVVPAMQVEEVVTNLPNTTDMLPNGGSIGVTNPVVVTREMGSTVSPDDIVEKTQREVNGEEESLPEFGNMTDHAITMFLHGNGDIPKETLIQGYTVNQWRQAREFNMTPRQYEVFSGEAPMAE